MDPPPSAQPGAKGLLSCAQLLSTALPSPPFSMTNLEEGKDLACESGAPAPQCSGEPGGPQGYPDTSNSGPLLMKTKAHQQGSMGSMSSIRAPAPDVRFQEEPFHAGTGAGGWDRTVPSAVDPLGAAPSLEKSSPPPW